MGKLNQLNEAERIYASVNYTIICSDNGLSHSRHQAIIWTSVGILLFGSLGTNSSEIWIQICTFSFKKMHLKMSGNLWWRHQMETFSALLALFEGNLPVTGWFPSQSPVMRSVNVLFDLRLNKCLSKQSRRRWFKTQLRSLWRHCNGRKFYLGLIVLTLYVLYLS